MGWKASDLPDLTGRRAIVTGANSGIGYVTALELARHGADVTLACRDLDKGNHAVARIESKAPGATVNVRSLDLGRLGAIRTFADEWTGPLDLLINNAGVMAPPRRRTTADGFELQMGTNHLGHFALTGRLLPHLLAAAQPRVVTVSSIAHTSALLDMDDLQSAKDYRPARAYGNSKLANLLFAAELQRRSAAAGANLVSTAAHPGTSATGLVSSRDGLGRLAPVRMLAPLVTKVVFQSAAAGARPTLYAATEAAPGSYTGPQLLGETRGAPGPASRSQAAQNPDFAALLWDTSEDLTGVVFDWSTTPTPLLT